jgi:transglutaminase-like putative cysteine protease
MTLRVILPLFLLFISATLVAREEYRYDVLVAGTPAGEILDIWEEVTVEGRCIVRSTSDMRLTLARGGFELQMRTRTIAEADCGTLRPRSLRIERDEGGGPVITKAQRVGDTLVSTTEKNGVVEKGVVPLGSDAVFFGMLFRKYPHDFFLKKGTVTALSEEGLVMRQVPFNGRRAGDELAVEMIYEGVPMSLGVRGNIVTRSTLNGGLIEYQLRGSAKPTATAPRPASGDVLIATAIENTGIAVKRPRSAVRLVMAVENAPAEIPATCHQKIEESDKEPRTVTVDTAKTPCAGLSTAADTAATLYEDKDTPAIVKTAAQWRHITDRRTLAKKIIRFVYDHITDKNYRHGTLSASETLAARAGDCTEHAALAAALLKSLGVPVRMAYGLVLSDDGRFFFHNWIEINSGDGWIPADPTFDQFPVDAARILLAHGGNGTEERENLSLTVLKFLQGTRISVTGFSHE